MSLFATGCNFTLPVRVAYLGYKLACKPTCMLLVEPL